MKRPDITVAVVGYNYAPFVAQALDSLLMQEMKPKEIVYVDDNSKDDSVRIAKRMGVRVVERKRNRGIVKNFNDVLMNQVTTSKLIMMGADNWAHPELIYEMSKYIDHDIVTYDLFVVGAEMDSYLKRQGIGKIYSRDGYYVRRFKEYEDMNRRIMRSNICHGSSMYDVELARKVGGYAHHPGKKRPEEDWHLWKRMAKEGAKMASAERPLLYYRRHKLNFLGVY